MPFEPEWIGPSQVPISQPARAFSRYAALKPATSPVDPGLSELVVTAPKAVTVVRFETSRLLRWK